VSASSALAAESIPNLDKRYRQHVKPTPRKLPAIRASFKATLWFSPAQYVQMMSMSAELKTGKMSLNAFLVHALGLDGAKDRVPRAAQMAAVRGMHKPPKHDELAARRRHKSRAK